MKTESRLAFITLAFSHYTSKLILNIANSNYFISTWSFYYTYSPLYDKQQLFNFAPMDIKVKIGIRLRELRKQTGLSQEKFAFECDLDRTYIASIEQGKRNVSISNIEKIAKALKMSIFEFFNSDFFKND